VFEWGICGGSYYNEGTAAMLKWGTETLEANISPRNDKSGSVEF
jgi:hypothetical protein